MRRWLELLAGLVRLLRGKCPKCNSLSITYCTVCDNAKGRMESWRKFRMEWKQK